MRVISWDIGIKNLAYCEISRDFKIHQWNTITLQNDCRKLNIDLLTQKLLGILDEKFSKRSDLTHVLIENQPSMKNPVMKSIQNVIYTFFQYIKLINNFPYTVKLVSATSKLKVRTHAQFPDNILKLKNKYTQKKKMAIFLCEYILSHIISNSNDFERFYSESKKKDDLADCMLYSIWFIQENEPILVMDTQVPKEIIDLTRDVS